MTRPVHVIVPDAIDDPARPSGGNRYDRRVSSGLADAGWRVLEHAVPDAFPRLAAAGARAVDGVMTELEDGANVLVDGLIATGAPAPFVRAAPRLRLVVLVHAAARDDPADRTAEGAVLRAARAVITTSQWTRDRLLASYCLPAEAVHVAEPGVDPASCSAPTAAGTRLLCVGAVAPHKGHDLLVGALAALAGLPWECACVGPLDHDYAYAARLRTEIAAAGLARRVCLTGPLGGAELDRAYRSADLLVHPARREAYGMVVTEALARGLPVIAAAAGGLPEALGTAPGGARPGILVPLEDVAALTAALRSWLTDADLRRRLRVAALARRRTLQSWSATTDTVARVLAAA